MNYLVIKRKAKHGEYFSCHLCLTVLNLYCFLVVEDSHVRIRASGTEEWLSGDQELDKAREISSMQRLFVRCSLSSLNAQS